MNELIDAAKAVIQRWETPLWKDAPPTAEYIYRLRDAVERAEKQEAVGFEEWWKSQHIQDYPWGERKNSSMKAWTAAQLAERERIKDLFRQSSDWFEDDQMAQAKWLMEKIDDVY